MAKGIEVTLFATENSITKAKLHSICPKGYEEDKTIDPKVWECLHISELFEHADEFDLIHNHFDFLPLSYSELVSTPVMSTIHGFSSPKILPVYEKYNNKVEYIAISNADRHPKLNYLKTIYHGIDLRQFTFQPGQGEYLFKDKSVLPLIQKYLAFLYYAFNHENRRFRNFMSFNRQWLELQGSMVYSQPWMEVFIDWELQK